MFPIPLAVSRSRGTEEAWFSAGSASAKRQAGLGT
jgi:hypothetical protein